MKLIDACKSGLAPAALLLLPLPSCDAETSQYDALRRDLRAYQQAATKTVDSMVAVQAGLTALAASGERSDEELVAAVRAFDEAVDDFGQAAEQIVAAETDIQNAIRDLAPSQSGVGVVQQALEARDVTNILTGGVSGLAEKMDANRQAINAAYDELYQAYDTGDMDGIEAAKAKINSLGQDTLFSWLKKTTTTLIAAPVGAVVEGVKKGAVALKFGVKTAVSAVWSKGCDVIAGRNECSAGIEAEGCAVSFNRTDEAGRAEVPAGNVTLLVSGDDLARVRLDDVPIAENEEKEIVLPETPISQVDEGNLANGEIPEPEDTATFDTSGGTDSSENEGAYILCVGTNYDDFSMHAACLPFNGSLEELNQLSMDELNGRCVGANYEQVWGTHADAASCIEECNTFFCDNA